MCTMLWILTCWPKQQSNITCGTPWITSPEELYLCNNWSKELKCTFVNPQTKPPCICREWDEPMSFIIPGRHLYVGPLRPAYIEKYQGMPRGFKESSSKSKGREPVTPHREEGSKHQHRFQPQTEGGDSLEKEAEYKTDDEGSDHAEDNITSTTTAPTGLHGDRRSEESNIESDRPTS